VSRYDIILLVTALAYGVALLGLNLLFGQAGLLSFGHAGFVAVGAYSVAVCTSRLGITDMEVILLLAAGTAAVVAVPIGALCVRYSGIHFGMLTLAFAMLFWSYLTRFSGTTGGDQGMPVFQLRLLGRRWHDGDNLAFLTGPYLVFTATVLLLAVLLVCRVNRSPFGLALRATRDHPLKASALGVGVGGMRLATFVLAAAFGAVGGALLAPVSGLADPTMAHWTTSGFLVFMVVLGGYRRLLGPLVGALAFVFLQERLQAATSSWRGVFGVILIVLVVAAPDGLAGLAGRAGRRLMRRVPAPSPTVAGVAE
jgi:branched-chain amino acid transport system permease protein